MSHPTHPLRRAALRALTSAPLAFAVGTGRTAAADDGRILVALELSGANDGLNTVVPYADDAYRRLRPRLAVPSERVRKLDERFGLNPGMAGLERLFKEGRVAIIHGCGYDEPSFSHFTSMAWWHTAAPHRGDAYGWLGRLADALRTEPTPAFIIDIGTAQSLAVRSAIHTPVAFNDPERFTRNALYAERELLARLADPEADPRREAESAMANPTRAWLNDVARSARDTSTRVREAWARYRTPVDYGIISVSLDKVAAMIDARLPARVYHVAYGNNAFDTHVQQAEPHQRLLTYVSDAVTGFQRDLERIGRAADVSLLVYSEFGRRAGENANLGTDHGTANVMFLIGRGVRGGHYGTPPDLSRLAPDGNLVHTLDFRRVYATAAQGWMQLPETETLLKGRFEPLPVYEPPG